MAQGAATGHSAVPLQLILAYPHAPYLCHIGAEAIAFGGTSMLRQELDPFKVSSPRIFLVRMMVFLTIGVLVVVILNRQI